MIEKEFLYLKDDKLKEFIEKLFMGYRESFADAKKTLNKYSIVALIVGLSDFGLTIKLY